MCMCMCILLLLHDVAIIIKYINAWYTLYTFDINKMAQWMSSIVSSMSWTFADTSLYFVLVQCTQIIIIILIHYIITAFSTWMLLLGAAACYRCCCWFYCWRRNLCMLNQWTGWWNETMWRKSLPNHAVPSTIFNRITSFLLLLLSQQQRKTVSLFSIRC